MSFPEFFVGEYLNTCNNCWKLTSSKAKNISHVSDVIHSIYNEMKCMYLHDTVKTMHRTKSKNQMCILFHVHALLPTPSSHVRLFL